LWQVAEERALAQRLPVVLVAEQLEEMVQPPKADWAALKFREAVLVALVLRQLLLLGLLKKEEVVPMGLAVGVAGKEEEAVLMVVAEGRRILRHHTEQQSYHPKFLTTFAATHAAREMVLSMFWP